MPDGNEAVRFLNQASFGANDTEIAKTRQYGYSAILEDQFYMPSPRTHEGYVNTVSPTDLGDQHVMYTFWREAATGFNRLTGASCWSLLDWRRSGRYRMSCR